MTDAPERICDQCNETDPYRQAVCWLSGCGIEPRADLTPSPEVVKELVEALRVAKTYIVSEASGSAKAYADLEKVNAVLAKLEGGE